jgi:PGF-CTERM protein
MVRAKTTILLILLVLSAWGTGPAASDGGEDAGGDGGTGTTSTGPGPLLDIIDPRLINATYTSRIPIINGEMDPNEWTLAENSSALWSQQPPAWEEKGAWITGPGIQNDSDCSHEFWTMYDADYLYFLFNCTDDSIWVDNPYPGKYYRDDGIEIAIDGAFDKDEDQRTTEGFDDGDTFYVPADGTQGTAYSFSANETTGRTWGTMGEWFSSATNHSTYYIVEVAIRLSAISGPRPGDFIGLNTGQNDDDDGGETKEGVLRWQGIDGYQVFSNETLWGQLYLQTAVRADASNPQYVNQSSEVTFDGSGSWSNHPDFDVQGKYTWTFQYGGATKTLSGERPSFTFDIPGEYIVTLNVTDGTDQWDKDTVLIGVRDTEKPKAQAGPDTTIVQGERLTFDGSGSTDNHPAFPVGFNFTWKFFDSNVIRLYGVKANHTFNDPGEFIITLRVTDIAGNYDEDTMTVTVRDTIDPVADPGPDLVVDEDDEAHLDGTRSHDNVPYNIARWVWEFYLGDKLVNLTGETVSYKFPAPGVYEVTLTVYDYDDNSGNATFTVTVLDVTPPTASAGESRIFNEDIEVTLNGELSWDNVGIVSYDWTIYLGDDVVGQLSGEKPRFNFTEPGLYDISLMVTDAMGMTHADTVQYRVKDVTKPVADAGSNRDVNEDVEVLFSAADSTDNVGIDFYNWTIDTTDAPRIRRTGEEFTYVFEEPKVYTITLTVTDGEDNWDSHAITVTVKDVTAPTAVPPDSVEIKVGQNVTFEGGGSDDNVGIVKYVWNYSMLDVPTTREGRSIVVIFEAKGNYTITLTVEDEAGNTDSETFWVNVVKPKEKDDGPGFGTLLALVAVAAAAMAAVRRRRAV